MTGVPLSELIRGLPVEGGEAEAHPMEEITVTGVAHDSRRVEPGDLYVAIPGERFDGRDFAADAEASGAVAVVGRGGAPAGLGVPWLEAEDPRALLWPLAVEVYGRPDRELTVVGVTGTNGKTTVTVLAAAVLEAAGRPAGVLGSLAYRFGTWLEPAERTTPEVSDLFRLLRRMRDEGAGAAAMEVSSHALALGRVEGVGFDLAVFTNLTQDHLDFHSDMEAYYRTKRSLFDRLKPDGRAVVGVDDPWGRRLAEELESGELEGGSVPVTTWGEEGRVRPLSVDLGEGGTRMVVETPRGALEVSSPLLGRFNAENLLAAVAAGEALELPHEAVRRGLAEQGPVSGRLEPVDRGQPFPVFVDYSHTPAALEAALRSVAELSGRKVILVFGCGGDRDRGKRAPMGRVAGELADLPIVTSDNPRSEDPLAIVRQVEEGLKESGNPRYRVVPDRREAIRRAVSVAGPESVVLVAGKGSETVQMVLGGPRRFSDREEIEKALEARFGSTKLG